MRHDRRYLEDILEAITKIEPYTSSGLEILEHDEPIQSLVLHYLQVIGEAVRSLSSELKDQHPEVPWRGIVGMRNILVHHYFQVNLAAVRGVIDRDLPPLKRQVAVILDALPRDDRAGP